MKCVVWLSYCLQNTVVAKKNTQEDFLIHLSKQPVSPKSYSGTHKQPSNKNPAKLSSRQLIFWYCIGISTISALSFQILLTNPMFVANPYTTSVATTQKSTLKKDSKTFQQKKPTQQNHQK
jgi:hypothetical protein